MATIKPYAGNSVDRLLRLVNDTNNTSLQNGVDLTLGAPEEITNHQSANTQVLVTFSQEGTKRQYIRYKRLDLANALDILPPSATSKVLVEIGTWPVSTHAYLDAINEALGLNLTADEVHNDFSEDEGQLTLPLRVRSGASYAWLPGQYNYKIERQTINLAEYLTVIRLDGLYPPPPELR